MDRVDLTFDALLGQFHGESRATIFHHMTRLYLRAAGDCRDDVGRWRKLNNRDGVGSGLTVQIELVVLSLFRLRPDTKLHRRLRQIYSYLGR